MPRRLAQQRMTLNDLERPFHTSCAISVVAELLVTVLVAATIIGPKCCFVALCFWRLMSYYKNARYDDDVS